tara:strand:- start:33089 stop:33499 length:411 start_codon:yes stop_codon:yes gene_type:complete
MTTIAYKDGVVACDSRMAEGGMILHDDYNKHKVVEGVHFFCAGSVDDIPALIQFYLAGEERQGRCTAIVVDEGEVLSVKLGDGFTEVTPVDYPYAIGSGTEFALAAMDMGADAKTAVKQAMKRDCFTGGRVRTFKV